MNAFITQEKGEVNEEENEEKNESQTPPKIHVLNEANSGLRRSTRNKRKKVSELDNYKIVHRTNMITYQERLKRYKQKNKTDVSVMTPPQRFKRRQTAPPPAAPSSDTQNEQNDDPHKNKKHKRNPS